MSDVPATQASNPAPMPNEQKGASNQSLESGNTNTAKQEQKPNREESTLAKTRAADEKFREAAAMRKQVEEFQRKLEEDPESFFNDPRIPKQKRREMAEKLLLKELQEEMSPELTPEQRKLQELEDYKKQKEQEELTAKEAKEKEEFQQIVKTRQEALAKTFQEALSHTVLSKHDATAAEVVREMAIYTRVCRDAGHDPSPKEIAEHVESRFMSSYAGITENLSGEELIGFLGKGIVKKLREYDLSQLEKRKDRVEPNTAEEWVSREDSNKKRDLSSPKDILRSLRNR